MYPSHLLQLCDAISVGNSFVVFNICALSSVCTLYTSLLVNVLLSLQRNKPSTKHFYAFSINCTSKKVLHAHSLIVRSQEMHGIAFF